MNPLLLPHAVAEPLGASFPRTRQPRRRAAPLQLDVSDVVAAAEVEGGRVAILAADFRLESEMLAQKLRRMAVMRRPWEV